MATEEQYREWKQYREWELEENAYGDIPFWSFGTFSNYLEIFFPWMENRGFFCPVGKLPIKSRSGPPQEFDCGAQPDTLVWLLVHLNDQHRWSREKIADWIEKEAERCGESIQFPLPEEPA